MIGEHSLGGAPPLCPRCQTGHRHRCCAGCRDGRNFKKLVRSEIGEQIRSINGGANRKNREEKADFKG